MRRPLAAAALALYVLALAAVTMGESPGDLFEWLARRAHRVDALSFVTVAYVERTLNVLLFVPAGLLLCYALPRLPRVLIWALCVLVSTSVELAQYYLPGRDATPMDVVTNSIGAGIGVLLHAVLTWRARQPARQQ